MSTVHFSGGAVSASATRSTPSTICRHRVIAFVGSVPVLRRSLYRTRLKRFGKMSGEAFVVHDLYSLKGGAAV
jgi:hypothetical protein